MTAATSTRRCALYRHFDAAGVLLYVGISETLVARGQKHATKSRWVKYAVRVEATWLSDRAAAERVEGEAIRSEHPIFNVQHNDTPEARAREAAYVASADRGESFTYDLTAVAKPAPRRTWWEWPVRAMVLINIPLSVTATAGVIWSMRSFYGTSTSDYVVAITGITILPMVVAVLAGLDRSSSALANFAYLACVGFPIAGYSCASFQAVCSYGGSASDAAIAVALLDILFITGIAIAYTEAVSCGIRRPAARRS